MKVAKKELKQKIKEKTKAKTDEKIKQVDNDLQNIQSQMELVTEDNYQDINAELDSVGFSTPTGL